MFVTFVTMEEIVERIKSLMDQKGLTASQLAEELQMNRPTLVHILNGRNKPNLALFVQLAQWDPELDLRYLLTGTALGPASNDEMPVNQEDSPPPTPSTPKAQPIDFAENPRVIEKIVVLNADGTFKRFVEES